MSILLRILAYVWLLLGLGKLLFRLMRKPSQPPKPAGENPQHKHTVRDPVCGMYMDPRLAIPASGREGDLYFCSEECRRRYQDSPQ